MDKLLSLLGENARLSDKDIAVMLDMTREDVEKAIADYEKQKIIFGYQALIDWDKVGNEHLIARIELKVTPKKGEGFEEIAKKIMQFDEVETVYLMSGSYDLAITVSGKTFKEVAMFVAKRLSPLEGVTSTATSFVLRKYKERGVVVCADEVDERRITTL
jgi:DNA-binding Lrp family transcriptional regulator